MNWCPNLRHTSAVMVRQTLSRDEFHQLVKSALPNLHQGNKQQCSCNAPDCFNCVNNVDKVRAGGGTRLFLLRTRTERKLFCSSNLVIFNLKLALNSACVSIYCLLIL